MLPTDEALLLLRLLLREILLLFLHAWKIKAGLTLHDPGLELASKPCVAHSLAIRFVYDALEILMSILKRLPKNIDLIGVVR